MNLFDLYNHSLFIRGFYRGLTLNYRYESKSHGFTSSVLHSEFQKKNFI